MNMGLFPEYDENCIYFSRMDEDESFSSFSAWPFELEGKRWPTVEHYFQAMKFEKEADQEKIRNAASPQQARRMGRSRIRRLRKDWKKLKAVYMTRAVYTKFMSWPDLQKKLLDTVEEKLVENSQYDYYWGCGRDRRGVNMYGQVLMNVRGKIREDKQQESQG